MPSGAFKAMSFFKGVTKGESHWETQRWSKVEQWKEKHLKNSKRFMSWQEVEQLLSWSKERHLILLIFCFIRGKCWTRGNIFCVVEHGKHFSNSSAPGYMRNGDLLKLFRLGTMTRTSHFACLRKQPSHAHDLKCAEAFILCTWSLFFSRFMFFSTTCSS